MTKKVLIVDDDQEILNILKKDLEKYSRTFSILTAEDGLNATEVLKRDTISLVVTDLKMPRMDGLKLLAHLRKNYPDIAVIVITGHSTPEKEKYAKEQGVVGYFNKPFIVDDLAKKIFVSLKSESDGGVLHGMSPGTFLQLVEMEAKTCTIRLTDDKSGNQGVLFFNEGELLDARTKEMHGRDAAYKILAWEEATLAIQESCSLTDNKIQADLQAVLLEAMRLRDEELEKEEKMTQEEIDEYIAAEKEKEKESDIVLEVEGPEIVIEEETKLEPEKEKPVKAVPSRPEKKPEEKIDIEDIAKPPATKKADVSYTMADNIFGTLSNLKETIFDSTIVRYTFRIFAVLALTGLIGFGYLFITMESDRDLLKKIDQAKADIHSKQQTLNQLDEEIQRLYTDKENSIKDNESQVVIMELELKISELEERQEKILTEAKIQQKALEEWQVKLEAMKRKSFFDRLFEGVEGYLP